MQKYRSQYQRLRKLIDNCLASSDYQRIPHYLNEIDSLFDDSKTVVSLETQKENQLLKTALEHSSSTVVITDPNGRIEYVNSSFIKTTGYSYQEAMGKNPRILRTNKTPENTFRDLWHTIKTEGNIWRGNFCNRKKNGDYYWEQAVISPVKDDNGVIRHYIAIKEDISHRKDIEVKFQTAMDHLETPIAVFSYDLTKLIYANDFFKNISYKRPENFDKNTLTDNIHPDDIALFYQNISSLYHLGRTTLQLRIRPKDDTKWHSYVLKANLIDSGKEKEDIYVSFFDITEIKNNQEQLENSRQFFQTLLDYTNTWESYYDHKGQPLYASPSFAQISGYSLEAFLHGHISTSDIIHHDDRSDFLLAMKRVESGVQIDDYQFRILRSDKRIIHVAMSAQAVYDIHGHYIGIRTSIRDNSLRRSAQIKLQNSEKHYRNVVASLSEGLIIFDMHGKIIEANKASGFILGMETSQLLTKTINNDQWHIFDENKKPLPINLSPINKTLSSGLTIKQTLAVERPDGKMIWLKINSVPIYEEESDRISSVVVTFVDITDQKQAQIEIVQSHARFVTLMECIDANIYVMDLHSHEILYANKNMKDTFGEVLGFRCHEIVFGSDQKCTDCRIFSEEGYGFDRYNPKLGQWFHINEKKITWEGNREAGLSISINITDRKRMEERIKKNANHLQNILATSNEGFWLIDKDLVTLDVNQSLCEILGRQKIDILGQSIYDFVDETNRKIFEREVRSRNKGRNGAYEVSLLRSDGSSVACLFNATPIQNENGKLIGSFAMVTDISDRKSFELALQESEKKYREIINTTEEGFWLLDANKTTLETNRALVRILGYETHEMLGRSPIEYASKDGKQILAEQMSKIDNTGHRSYEITFRHKNGFNVPTMVNATTIHTAHGKAAFAFISDISELKAKEMALNIAKEKAEAANRAKSEFLANMSHEIRTPLNAVLGLAEMLDMEINNPVHKNYLTSIQNSGKILLNIINDILDLSKIEAGKMLLRLEPVSLRLLMNEIESVFTIQSQKKNIDWRVSFSEDLPEIVYLDELHLRQIMLNLVGNAFKFTEKGSVSMALSAKKQIASDYYRLMIAVQDTGIGIPHEDQRMIFEDFTQKEGQNARKYGGTGLGLAISSKLARLMGGRIDLESQLGQGSIFSLVIDNVRVMKSHSQNIIADYESLHWQNICFSEATVLIVDDVASNREIIIEALKKSDLRLLTAENGQIALEMAIKYQVDVILLDIRMPVMDGFSFMEHIIREPRLNKIPVIATTASMLTSHSKRLRKYQFHEILRKPISIKSLVHVLMRYLPYKEAASLIIDQTSHVKNEYNNKIILNFTDKESESSFIQYMRPFADALSQGDEVLDLDSLHSLVVNLETLAKEKKIEDLLEKAQLLKTELKLFNFDRVKSMVSRLCDCYTKTN